MMGPSELGISLLPDLGPPPTDSAGAAAAACTSDARTSPPGPEARTVARCTPHCLARRRALGEIFAVDVGAGTGMPASLAATREGSIFASDPALAVGAVDSLSAGGSSPGATI